MQEDFQITIFCQAQFSCSLKFPQGDFYEQFRLGNLFLEKNEIRTGKNFELKNRALSGNKLCVRAKYARVESDGGQIRENSN